jgi:hypothetical protein
VGFHDSSLTDRKNPTIQYVYDAAVPADLEDVFGPDQPSNTPTTWRARCGKSAIRPGRADSPTTTRTACIDRKEANEFNVKPAIIRGDSRKDTERKL